MNLGSCVTLIRAYAKVPWRHKLVSLEQYSWNCTQLPAFQCGSRQSIPFDVYPNHAYKGKCLAHILPPSAYSNCQAQHISLLPATGSSYCVCHKACINASISIQHWPCSFWLHIHSIIFLTSTVILLFHMWAAAQTGESSTFTATSFGCKPVSYSTFSQCHVQSKVYQFHKHQPRLPKLRALLHGAFSWCILLLHIYDQHIKKVSACSHSVHLGVMPKFLIHGQKQFAFMDKDRHLVLTPTWSMYLSSLAWKSV